MRPFWLICVLFALATEHVSAGAATLGPTDSLSSVQSWHARLQEVGNVPSHETGPLRRAPNSARALAGKLAATRALAEYLTRHGQVAGSYDTQQVQKTLMLTDPKAPGASCEAALLIEQGQRLSIDLAAGKSFWIRWRADRRGDFLLSSRGSAADTLIEQLDSCADTGTVLSRNDDTFGLNAELSLSADLVGQSMLFRVSKLSQSGKLVLGVSPSVMVSGRIFDDVSGEPLAGLRVSLLSQSGARWFNGESDVSGRFRIGVPLEDKGEYFARTYSPGWGSTADSYVQEAVGDAACSNQSSPWLDSCAQSPSVDVGQNGLSGLDFALSKGHRVHGRVTQRNSGEALANAWVEFYREAEGGGFSAFDTSTYTDHEGRYEASGLISGSWKVLASRSDHESRWHNDQPCVTTDCSRPEVPALSFPAGATTEIDFALQQRSYITVRTTPVFDFGPFYSFRQIAVRRANGVVVGSVSSPPNIGPVRVGPLEPGDYLVQARQEGTFWTLFPDIRCERTCEPELSGGELVRIESPGQQVELEIPVTAYPFVRGTVTDAESGQPIVGATVRLHASGLGQENAHPRTSDTDDQGRYQIGPIEPNDYLAVASSGFHIDEAFPSVACESENPVADCAAATPLRLDLQSGDQTIDFALSPTPLLRLQLLEGARVVDPSAVSYLNSVRLLDANGEVLRNSSVSIDAESKHLLVGNMPPGTYRVGVRLEGFLPRFLGAPSCTEPEHAFDDWLSSCDVSQAEPIQLTEGQVTRTLQLEPRYARLVKVVDDTSGADLADVTIDVWLGNGDLAYSVRTDTTGHAWARVPGVEYWSQPTEASLSTDNYQGYIDQVHDRISCPEGASVYRGGCGLEGSTTLEFPNLAPVSGPILFRLARSTGGGPGSGVFFVGDFE